MQVNITRDQNKHGVLPEHALEFAATLTATPGLRLHGLMTIPRATDDHQGEGRRAFAALRQLAANLHAQGIAFATSPPALSMGMSADFEVAIEEGATHVRVGSAIFGSRA